MPAKIRSRAAVSRRAPPEEGPAVEENVRTIKAWEHASRESRTRAEQVSDWVSRNVACGPVMIGHLIWFGAWIAVNLDLMPVVGRFDPFPFPLLTMIVSLEAIFLALFVLSSQNRLTHQADRRSELNLQIDLLAEREMTAVLQLLRDIASHLNVRTTVTSEQLRDLARKTDVRRLTDRVEELDEEEENAPRTK